MILVLLACSGDDATEPVDTAPIDPMAAVPVSACGLEPYAFVDPSTLGEVISVEEAADLSLTAGSVRAIAGLAGVPAESLDIQYDVRTWRVRYTTQDRGEAVEATMLVSFPDGAGDVPTWLWTHPTTGFTDACAPSALGLEGGAFNLLFASLGVVVVGPDYLGMSGFGTPSGQLHPYTVAEPTALASLDAVRAAWAFQETEASLTSRATPQTVIMGASEGGFGALWADRYQPAYLPEADVVAVVAAVPPADMTGLMRHGLTVDGDTTFGLVGALTTWHDWYRWQRPLSDVLQSDVADVLPDAMLQACDPTDVTGELGGIDDLFTAAFVDAIRTGDDDAFPDITCMAEANSLATSDVPRASTAPVLYVVAENDELVAAAPTRAAFGPLCDAGYTMEYIECAGADHVQGAVWSLPTQIDWAFDRLAGLPLDAPCVQGAPETCVLDGIVE